MLGRLKYASYTYVRFVLVVFFQIFADLLTHIWLPGRSRGQLIDSLDD